MKQVDGALQVRIDDGCWSQVEAKRESRDGRFTVRCSIDGQLSSFSAVISPEEVSIFNEVIGFISIINNISNSQIFVFDYRTAKPSCSSFSPNS